MSSSLLHSLTNNNTSTDDEEHRINLLFPKCKVRGPHSYRHKQTPKSTISNGESETKYGLSANFPNSHGLEGSDSNANSEKLFSGIPTDRSGSEKCGSLYIDNRQSGTVGSCAGPVPGQILAVPGRAQRERQEGEDVSGVYNRKAGYHYNISNQRRSSHNHNSCRSPCGIDRRQLKKPKSKPQPPKSTTSPVLVDVNSRINKARTADSDRLEKKLLDKGSFSPQSPAGEKMDLDNSVVGDEDSGHFDNGTGSGSNGSTFSESNTPLSGGSGGSGSLPAPAAPLHDSRIEIAGGREIFSQNKTRAGRRGRGGGGSSTMDFQPHFSQSQTSASRRKVIPPGTANLSPRYATKKSPLGRDSSHQSPASSSSVWELQVERKEEGNKQFGGPPRIRNSYRHYGGSYKQKHKSGNSYGGQLRTRPHHCLHQSFPSYGYYAPPNARHNNFSRDPISMSSPPFQAQIPRVHGTIKETMFGTEITSVEKSLIYDEMGRVVSCDQRLRTLEPSQPRKSSSVYGRDYVSAPGGDIVFDDIEDWRAVEGEAEKMAVELNSSSYTTSNPPGFWESRNADNEEKAGKLSYTQIMESSSSLCPSIQVEGNTSPSGYESDEMSPSAPPRHPNFLNENKRLIGNLPIAEYEGSPRRYGVCRQPPGTATLCQNELDLVDLSTGVHVPFPSSHTFDGSSGTKSPDTKLSSLISDLPTSIALAQQSPNNGTRLPGFPQRVRTNPAQGQKDSYAGENILQQGNSVLRGNGEVMDFSVIDIVGNSKRIPRTAYSAEECKKGSQSQEALDPFLSHEVSPGCSKSGKQFQSNGTGISPTAEEAGRDMNEIRSLTLSREQCDYLYEFSETRKVLEEFFHSGAEGGKCPGESGASPSDFDELDYTLRRQNGNSYVGQRLAGEVYPGGVEESPKIPPRRGGREVVMSLGIPLELEDGTSDFGSSSRLITLHDVSSLSPASKNSPADEAGNRDVNDNDLDVETASTNTETDLGETEIGHQVRHHTRNYALSPGTTDCDSNELESEMSLDYEVSLHSSSRLGTTMPVLEDGLSSGNASDNDEDVLDERQETGAAMGRGSHDSMSSNLVNPTLLLMKKQITEIEKEIQMRASNCGGKEGANQEAGNHAGMSMSGPFPADSGKTSVPLDGSEELSANANTKVHHEVAGSSDRNSSSLFDCNDPELEALDPMRPTPPPSPAPASVSHQSHSHNLSSSTTSLRPVTSSITQAISPPKLSSLPLLGPTPSTTVSSTANGTHLSTPATAFPPSKESISTQYFHHTESSAAEPLKLISSIMTPPDSSNPPLSHHRAKQYQLPKFDATSFTSLLPKPSSLSLTTGPVCPPQDDSPQSELHESSSEERLGPHGNSMSPVWVPRRSILRGDRNQHGGFGLREPFLRRRYEEIPDDDADTDQETDRLLGQHRTEDDYGFYNEKDWKKTKLRGILGSGITNTDPAPPLPPPLLSASSTPNAKGLAAASSFLKGSSHVPVSLPSSASTKNHSSSSTVIPNTSHQPPKAIHHHLSLNSPTAESEFPELPLSLPPSKPQKEKEGAKKKRNKEDFMKNPSVLIEGVLFRARYLGSTQLISEGQPTKATRMLQAEEAVSRIKAQANQTSTAGLSDSTVSLLSSSSSSITLPLVLSASTDDEPTSPPASFRRPTPTHHSHQTAFHLPPFPESQLSPLSTLHDSSPTHLGSSERIAPPRLAEDSSTFIVDNDDAFEFDPSLLRQSPSDSCKSQNNSSTSSDGSGSVGFRSRLRIQQVPPSHHGLRPTNSSFSSEFQYCPPPCGSAVTGTMFHLRFVGSLEVEEEVGSGRNRRKRAKKVMVEEAVLELKAPDGETQPSTEVDLFISTEKIMVLNTDLKEIMMDHALRTISYIADIGDLVVLMARRRPVPTDTPEELSKIHRPPKMICHVFESDEAQYIAQSIGQAFQVAYMEFLKANGIEDHSFVREMDYQEVLNSQEIFGDELQMFAKKELQKDVVVPKAKGEILGVVIVESGWGSMLPTVVIANLAPAGAAARCGQLNIGDQIIAINGVSLVGLPLSTCQTYIKNSKTQTVVKLTVVPCPPVVEVKIKRPDTKYQLGFSVQNGVICSLLRGGIAERGGVRVGHRIIEINNQSVVAVPHEKIVNLLATSVGEINMKTMPTSMFRLLTGQETPLYI